MKLFDIPVESQSDRFIEDDFWLPGEYNLSNQLLIDMVLPQPASQKKFLNRTLVHAKHVVQDGRNEAK